LTGSSGAYNDTIDYSAAASGITVSLASGTASDDGDGGADTLSGIESVIGSAYADTITWTSTTTSPPSSTAELRRHNQPWHGNFGAGDSIIGGSGTDALFSQRPRPSILRWARWRRLKH